MWGTTGAPLFVERVVGLREARQRVEDVAVGDLGLFSYAAVPYGSSSFLVGGSMELVGTLGTPELSRGGADVHCAQMDALGRLVARELWAGLVVQEEVQSCTTNWARDSGAGAYRTIFALRAHVCVHHSLWSLIPVASRNRGVSCGPVHPDPEVGDASCLRLALRIMYICYSRVHTAPSLLSP